MKIGVLTHWESNDNYGQQLQCWALQHYLRAQGHDAFLIRCEKQAIYKKKSTAKRIKRFLKNAILWLVRNTPMGNIKKLHNLCVKLCGRDVVLRRFDMFREEQLSMTKIYHSYEELKKNPPFADIYSAGSDQIWNLDLPLDWWEIAFLQFGKEDAKRISYAPSMPFPNPTDEQISLLKKYLASYSAISTREQSSTDLIQSLDYKSEVVLDPTLLLSADDYRGLYKLCATKPNVFIYSLNYTDTNEIPIDNIKQYANENGMDVIVTPSSGYTPACELFSGVTYEYPTIPNWLQRINSTEFLVTSSFHGIVFAILMHRPFLFTPLIGQYERGNIRATELLTKLNISDRIWDRKTRVEEYVKKDIDWVSVDAQLHKMRAESLNYLNNAINQ